MKFGELKSIAHNIADSLASGDGFLIGVYQMDVFGEAAKSAEGHIQVDFLSGTTSGGAVSSTIAEAIVLYREALPTLCKKHGADVGAFRALTARYCWVERDARFIVTVEDQHGHRSVDDYESSPGRRERILDDLGRIRRMPPNKARSTGDQGG